MKRMSWITLVLGVLAAVVLSTAPGTTAQAAPVGPSRQFTATGSLGRYYTVQTVTGTYQQTLGRPFDVSVFDWQGNVLVFNHRPSAAPNFWGGYWHDAYGLDQWYVGRTGTASFHLMLYPPPMGSTFTALLVTEFRVGGNWQNWMDGTSG